MRDVPPSSLLLVSAEVPCRPDLLKAFRNLPRELGLMKGSQRWPSRCTACPSDQSRRRAGTEPLSGRFGPPRAPWRVVTAKSKTANHFDGRKTSRGSMMASPKGCSPSVPIIWQDGPALYELFRANQAFSSKACRQWPLGQQNSQPAV